MKKARMNISHSRFILFKLQIFGEIVSTYNNTHRNEQKQERGLDGINKAQQINPN